MKLYTIILAVVIINLVGFSVFYIYNFSQFSIGEFVYKIGDEGIRIGKTEGVGLPVNYLVRWDNGEYTTEYPFSLKKISWLEDKEVETFFEAQGKQVYTSYPSFGTQEEGTIIGEDENADYADSVIPVVGRGKSVTYDIKLKGDECSPLFICDDWNKCGVEYNVYEFLKGQETVTGVQYRYCKDYRGCAPSFVETKSCVSKMNIRLEETTVGNETYLEVYGENNKLVSRIKKTDEGYQKLDITFVI